MAGEALASLRTATILWSRSRGRPLLFHMVAMLLYSCLGHAWGTYVALALASHALLLVPPASHHFSGLACRPPGRLVERAPPDVGTGSGQSA